MENPAAVNPALNDARIRVGSWGPLVMGSPKIPAYISWNWSLHDIIPVSLRIFGFEFVFIMSSFEIRRYFVQSNLTLKLGLKNGKY